MRPVIQPGTLEVAVFQLEAQRLDEVEVDARGGTRFIPRADGTRRYMMSDSVQSAAILSRFVEMIPFVPSR